jgi:hypothetical protein
LISHGRSVENIAFMMRAVFELGDVGEDVTIAGNETYKSPRSAFVSMANFITEVSLQEKPP